MFFKGQLPHRRTGAAYNYSPEAPSLWGWGADRIKNISLSSFVCSFLFFSLCHADAAPPRVCHLDNCVSVEVVSKPEDMQHGLMFRAGLAKDTGMLFVFAHDDIQRFWMKNMSFNLDIVWISHGGRIVFINRNVPPCREDFFCPVYAPNQACRYVLELNGGYTASHGWKVGDNLSLEGIFLEK